MPRGLLVRVGEPDERRLAPRTAEQGEPGGEHAPAKVPHGYVDGGEARGRREQLAVVAVGRVQVTDEPGWVAPGRIDERVELLVVHELEDRGAQLRAELLAR